MTASPLCRAALLNVRRGAVGAHGRDGDGSMDGLRDAGSGRNGRLSGGYGSICLAGPVELLQYSASEGRVD